MSQKITVNFTPVELGQTWEKMVLIGESQEITGNTAPERR